MSELEETKEKLKEVIAERNKYHAALTDLRLEIMEADIKDHEARIRPLEDGQIKANTIYALFAGNGLLSAIALFKIFVH